MINLQLLSGLLFALPILAMAIHLLFIRNPRAAFIKINQFIFSLLLVVLAVLLFLNNKDIAIIYVAGWAAPYGICIVFDQLTTVMLLIFSTVIFCISLFSFQDKAIKKYKISFYCGFWLLVLGVIGALCTYDIFNLYVWSEVMLVSAFVLLSANKLPIGFKVYHYAVFNIIGTLFMLLAIALLYGITGNLNYAAIAQFFHSNDSGNAVSVLVLFLLGLGIKGGLFPFYFWLPTAYPRTSASSTMLLASLITKVIMLVILRLAWLWLPLHEPLLQNLFIFIACCTMFFGVMGAANHFQIRDILSFHVISQLGYILLAIFINTPLAIIAATYFLIHNVFVKTHLLMVSGIIEQHYKVNDLNQIGLVMKDNPILAVMFFISAMSLAGFPPLSGFWGKLFVLKATFVNHHYIALSFAILVSLFTLYSMIKIWRLGFCQTKQKALASNQFKLTAIQLMASLPLFFIPLMLGLYPHIIVPTLKNVAVDLNQPQIIINKVLAMGEKTND